MIRKKHNHTLQPNPRHREGEPQNTDGEEIAGCFACLALLVSRECCEALHRGSVVEGGSNFGVTLVRVCEAFSFETYPNHIIGLRIKLPIHNT